MMKKLGIVVMTAFFSVSVAGLSFADEAKKPAVVPLRLLRRRRPQRLPLARRK